MGGYGTWFQATHRPDLWASVSPQAGATKPLSRYRLVLLREQIYLWLGSLEVVFWALSIVSKVRHGSQCDGSKPKIALMTCLDKIV